MGEIRTGDGVTLRYLEAGSGSPLVIVPGWSATAATFHHQLDGLSERCRVIALDPRGHGTSDKPAYGYRVSRLAADVHDLLAALDLREVTLLGHSLGCVVIWSYLDLFGNDRLRRLVLADQPAVVRREPGWNDEVVKQTGAPFTVEQIHAMVDGLRGAEGNAVRAAFFAAMPTDQFPAEELAWLQREAEQFPAPYAAQLFVDGTAADYRDLFARITLPTLYIGGRVKTVRMSAQRWICEQIPGAQHVTFSAEDRGSHLLYLENPAKFNEVVASFMAAEE